METKSEKQGDKPQMMIIMDELFRSDEGASFRDIVDYYCIQRKYDSKTKLNREEKLISAARVVKTELSKRLETRGIKIIEAKRVIAQKEKDRRHKISFFRYSEDPGEFDPVEDLKYKFKKMKLSELSEILVQTVGLFPKSWLMNFSTQVDEFNNKVSEEDRINKIIYFDNNEELNNLHILPTLVEIIKKKQVIRFRYQPFDKCPYFVTVHPQILKEYNLRWFLFALAPDKDGHLRDQQFALDRIDKRIVTCEKIPYIKSETDYKHYFSERVGVSGQRAKTIEVEILVDDKRTLDYIQTKPIHHSQIIKDNIIYYQIKDNYEFETKLFEFADKISILKPIELRAKIISRASQIIDKYKE